MLKNPVFLKNSDTFFLLNSLSSSTKALFLSISDSWVFTSIVVWENFLLNKFPRKSIPNLVSLFSSKFFISKIQTYQTPSVLITLLYVFL